MSKKSVLKPAIDDNSVTLEIVLKRDPKEFFQNRIALKYLDRSPAHFLAYCAVIRALKELSPYLRKSSSVLGMRVPLDWPPTMFENILEKVFRIDDLPRGAVGSVGVFVHPDFRELRKKSTDLSVIPKLSHPHLLVLAPLGVALLPELSLVVAHEVYVKVCAKRDLVALAKLRGNGSVDDETAQLLRDQPPSYLTALFRQDHLLAKSLGKLRDQKKTSVYDREALTLHKMPGFRNAATWGKSLQRDIHAWRSGKLEWSEIDKGVLFIGEPGTGKTMFAEILANTCEIAFYPHSLPKWQAKGHMGDLLQAMNAAFETAIENAPSLLFLDELDSIGDRETFKGDNEHYQTEVLNALLERIDGSVSRDGVIIAGATNYPGKIDKALLRSGRLEKHIIFDLPDAEECAEILQFYLPELGSDADLRVVAERLKRWTPADLERLSRNVRRQARYNDRAVTIADLKDQLPIKKPMLAADRRRLAVHEAGHALIATLIGLEIGHVRISDALDAADQSLVLGLTSIKQRPEEIRSSKDILDQLAVDLAGTAAEQVIFGERSTFASGEDHSDLANATALAFKFVSKFGLARRLVYLPRQTIADLHQNETLRAEVDKVLAEQLKSVIERLEGVRTQIIELSDELLRLGIVSGQRVVEIVGKLGSTEARPELLSFLDHQPALRPGST